MEKEDNSYDHPAKTEAIKYYYFNDAFDERFPSPHANIF